MTTRQTANAASSFTPDELARRRAASRRLAWILGVAALAIYLAGLFFRR